MARIKYYDSVAQEWAYADMAVQLPPSRLPAGYQEVEYIESDGTGQYIDTGVAFSDTLRLVIEESMESSVSDFRVSGAVYTNGSTNFAISFGNVPAVNNGNLSVLFLSKASLVDSDWATTSVANDGTKRTIDLQNGSQKVNGVEIATQTMATVSATKTIPLFARNKVDDTIAPFVPEKIYSCKIYNNGVIVRYLIPCYLKDDNTQIGLFDIIGNKFYTNDGTGTFTKGADV